VPAGKSAVWLADFFYTPRLDMISFRRLKPFFLFRINLHGLTNALFFLFGLQGQRQRAGAAAGME